MSDEFSKLFKDYDDKVKLISGNYAELSKLAKKINDRLVSDKDSNEKFVEKMKKFKPIESEIIKFNLGGQTFSTLKSTITKKIKRDVIDDSKGENENESNKDVYYQPSVLEGLINGLVDIKYDENKAIFIDRNPQYFSHILDYLREANGEINYELPQTNDNYKGLLKEAEYFNVQGLVELIKEESTFSLPSQLVTQAQTEELFSLCGFTKKDKWILLYRGSRDGFGSDVFHTKCDNQARTLIIAKSIYGYIFGGYTDQAWSSDAAHKNDPNAFLFSLNNKAKFTSNGTNSIYCHPSYGPAFGSARDLLISNNPDRTSCSSSLGYSYTNSSYQPGTTQIQQCLAGNLNFTLTDYEVFHRKKIK